MAHIPAPKYIIHLSLIFLVSFLFRCAGNIICLSRLIKLYLFNLILLAHFFFGPVGSSCSCFLLSIRESSRAISIEFNLFFRSCNRILVVRQATYDPTTSGRGHRLMVANARDPHLFAYGNNQELLHSFRAPPIRIVFGKRFQARRLKRPLTDIKRRHKSKRNLNDLEI